MSTERGPILTATAGAMFVEFSRAAAVLFPAATSAADAAAARREARVSGGVPERIVPFVKASAARFAARVNSAAANATDAPFDAALIADAATPIGSAEYRDATAVAVVLMDAASVASTVIVTVEEPSTFVDMVGTTVKFKGVAPAAALFITS